MRYIVNASNYITAVSFGCEIECQDNECTEYTGSVPTGYTSLEDWYAKESETLYRWKIVSGKLTLVTSAEAPDADARPLFARAVKTTWSEIDSAQAPGWYYIAEENTICGHTASYWYMHVVSYSVGTAHCTQTLYSVKGDYTFDRRQNTGTWSAWVNTSPSSYIKYDLLWENASRTSSFAAQTITVDTTAYNFLAVEVAYNEKEMNGSEICFVGMRKKGYGDTVATLTAHLITSTGSFNTVSRKLTIKSARGSIVADGGIGSGGGASDTNAIPVKIYGVKGV